MTRVHLKIFCTVSFVKEKASQLQQRQFLVANPSLPHSYPFYGQILLVARKGCETSGS